MACPARVRVARARAGRAPLTLVLVLALGAVLVLGVRQLEARARARGIGVIDPITLGLGELPAWADPRWCEEFDALTAEWPPFEADDGARVAAFAAAVGELPFVREVRACEVLWPDALALDLVLRRPVACIPSAGRFRAVAEDGTLLTGTFGAPPRLGAGYLPVLGPVADGEGVFDGARAGDWLAEADHLDALAVARSLRAHLDGAALARLGRATIDATRGRAASVEEAGVRLLLEDARLVLFGRPPHLDEPGERPAAQKWASLDAALTGLPATDWDLLDVRWDKPAMRRRGGDS